MEHRQLVLVLGALRTVRRFREIEKDDLAFGIFFAALLAITPTSLVATPVTVTNTICSTCSISKSMLAMAVRPEA